MHLPIDLSVKVTDKHAKPTPKIHCVSKSKSVLNGVLLNLVVENSPAHSCMVFSLKKLSRHNLFEVPHQPIQSNISLTSHNSFCKRLVVAQLSQILNTSMFLWVTQHKISLYLSPLIL